VGTVFHDEKQYCTRNIFIKIFKINGSLGVILPRFFRGRSHDICIEFAGDKKKRT
jgi:hypothetical protein